MRCLQIVERKREALKRRCNRLLWMQGKELGKNQTAFALPPFKLPLPMMATSFLISNPQCKVGIHKTH